MKLEMDFLSSRYFCRTLAATNVSSAPKYVHLQSWSLKLSDGWARYKEKVPDVSDCIQNVETTCSSKLKFTELKDLFIKRVQKNC